MNITRTWRRERSNVVTRLVDVRGGLVDMWGSLEGLRTIANLVGVMSGLLAIVLLLALPEPWNIRVPLYLTVLVWTIIRPRVALYLMPFAVPWGSLDYIDIRGLRINSADILIAFLAIGWLLSFALRSSETATLSLPDTFMAKARPRRPWHPQGPIHPQPSPVPLHVEGSRSPGLDGASMSLPSAFPNVSGRETYGPRDGDLGNVPVYLICAILALLGAMVLSMTVALNMAASLKEISKWLEFLVLVLLGAQYIRTRRQLWMLIVLVCLAAITQAGFGYVQAFLNLGPVSFVRGASLRIYGTFDQPNPYAGYINIPLSITMALMLLGSNWKMRILAALTTLPLVVAEYLTQSRGAEIALAAALLFIVTMGMLRVRVFIRLLVVAGLGVAEAFLLGLIPLYILNPLLRVAGLIDISLVSPNDQTFSTAERLAHWIAGLHMFFEHPILGVGIGNYADAYPHYVVANFLNPLGHAHNYYINIAAETGSIGLIAYLLFLLALFVAGANSYRFISRRWIQTTLQRPTPRPLMQKPVGMRNKLRSLMRLEAAGIADMLANDRALAVGLLAALISVCAHNFFDNLYVHSLTNLMALLLIALIRLEKVTP